MLEASIIYIRLLLLIPTHSPAVTLLIGGVSAFLLAFILTFLVKAFCYKVGWLDKPAARRVHTKAVPRLGGVAIFLAFVIAALPHPIQTSTSIRTNSRFSGCLLLPAH